MASPVVASRLLAPLRLGELSLKNRVCMAPLTRCRASADGVPVRILRGGVFCLLAFCARHALLPANGLVLFFFFLCVQGLV